MNKNIKRSLYALGITALACCLAFMAYHFVTDWERTCDLAHKAYTELRFVKCAVDIAVVIIPITAVLYATIGILCLWKDRFEGITEVLAMPATILTFVLILLIHVVMFSNMKDLGIRLRNRRLAREARSAQEAASQTNETATATTPDQPAPVQ